jgi:hypothetical protein
MISKLIAALSILILLSTSAQAAGPLWSLKHSIRSYRKLAKPEAKHFNKMKKAFARAKRAGNGNQDILRYLTKRIRNSKDKVFYKETMSRLDEDHYDAEESIFIIMEKIRLVPKHKYQLIEALYGAGLVMVYGFSRG